MGIGAGAIKAGAAFVELFTDASKLDKGLNQAAAKCKAWGGKVRNIGAAIFAAGGAALGGLGAIVSQAAEIGGQFQDLSQKTGASVESLSLLKYAAEQNGGSLEMVGKGITYLQKNLDDARQGGKETTEAFTRLGVSLDELSKLSPDEQFLRMADAIANVTDPTERTALAMKVFGKSGAELIPLLSQGSEAIRGFMGQAEKMGLKLSTTEVQALDDFGDAWGAVKEQATRAAIGIGGALAPALTDIATKIQTLMVKVIDWIQKNGETIISTAKLVVEVTAAGAAMLVFGQAISTVGTLITGFNTLLKFSIANARGLGAALAVVGITLFAQQVYQANAAIRDFNDQMDRAQGLNSRVIKVQVREQRKVLEEAGTKQGDDKKEFLNEELENAQTNLSGFNQRIKDQTAAIEKADPTGAKELFGDPLVKAARAEIATLERRRSLAEDYVNDLQDAWDAENKPKAAPDAGPVEAPKPESNKPANDEFQKKRQGDKGFDLGGSSAGAPQPQSPIDKEFQKQRDRQNFELQKSMEERDRAIEEARKQEEDRKRQAEKDADEARAQQSLATAKAAADAGIKSSAIGTASGFGNFDQQFGGGSVFNQMRDYLKSIDEYTRRNQRIQKSFFT